MRINVKCNRCVGAGLLLMLIVGLQACTTAPKSTAEQLSGYTYVPLDPFPVYIDKVATGEKGSTTEPAPTARALPSANILQLLPDNAVRMSVESYDLKGNAHYGPAAVGSAGDIYHVTVDYINAD